MAVPPILDKHSKAKTPRRFARQRIETLVYVDLSSENGGFPLDISEDGMAFQGILPLKKDQIICVAFKLPGIDGSITATARIAWLNNSQKGGALQFIDFPQDSRILLGNWLSMRRQAGNPKENRTVAASGALKKDLPPAPGVSSRADHTKSSVKTSPVVAAPSPIPALPSNQVAQAKKPKVIPKFEPYVQSSGVKKRFQVTAVAFVLSILMLIATINLWQFRLILFPHRMSNHPAQPAVLTVPELETPLPLAKLSAIESLSDRPSVAATANADEREVRTAPAPPSVTTSVPSRPVATARPRPPQIKTGKLSNVHAPRAQDTRPPDAAVAPASSGRPITVAPSPILASASELPAEPAGGKNSSPAVSLPQESVIAAGSIEIRSDPHPSVRMTPELEWRASWPGINPTYGRLISSVEPQYPKDALRQRIAGAVRLHVVIGRSGAVEKVEPTGGPAPLSEAAIRAVQQWHFEPTLLAGQPIETEQNITIVFRIANPNATGN
ncbi:MAG: TonB family protein [Candidatus Acidiferrales bacterium]|jgi:protein TonB